MILRSVRVKNFRCVKDEILNCEALTVLVGRNGSGKSSFLTALELFYNPAADYADEDFYDRNASDPILVIVTFGELTEAEMQAFAVHLDRETLTVEKEMTWPRTRGSQKYYGSTLGYPPFQGVRAATKVGDKREVYQGLVESGRVGDLPKLPGNASSGQIDQALARWEEQNPSALQRVRDNGQFFGFKEVGSARLEQYTRFLYVPAVRDASDDASDERGSVVSQLMDLVVRSALAQSEDLRSLRERTQQEYSKIIDPERLAELRQLDSQMTTTLGLFAPGARVELNWQVSDAVQIPLPRASVRVIEDGYATSVERAGHGVQRAFILTALQYLAVAQTGAWTTMQGAANARTDASAQEVRCTQEGVSSGNVPLPGLILAIEEPELYQHPSRQRHLSQLLLKLATGGIGGVAQSTQVLYATHSPLFVDLHRFDQVRLLRKEDSGEGKPRQTKVYRATMEQVALDVSIGVKALRARLQTLMTPWTNEGFFADVVVLVEGEEDRAAILGMAREMSYDMESRDIAVIPCMGKANLTKAAAVFRTLKIPVYVLWDSDLGDKKAKPDDNHSLLKFHGAALEDWPEMVTRTFACFRRDLDYTLREEVTPDLYDSLLSEARDHFAYPDNDRARKNPIVMERIIQNARKAGKTSGTLEAIVGRVLDLQGGSVSRQVTGPAKWPSPGTKGVTRVPEALGEKS